LAVWPKSGQPLISNILIENSRQSYTSKAIQSQQHHGFMARGLYKYKKKTNGHHS